MPSAGSSLSTRRPPATPRTSPGPICGPTQVSSSGSRASQSAVTVVSHWSSAAGWATTPSIWQSTAFESPRSISRRRPSPGAKRGSRDSAVTYAVGDLLAPPPDWRHAFDFVLEVYTLQVLPRELREQAIARLGRHGKAGRDALGDLPRPPTGRYRGPDALALAAGRIVGLGAGRSFRRIVRGVLGPPRRAARLAVSRVLLAAGSLSRALHDRQLGSGSVWRAGSPGQPAPLTHA